MGNDFFILLPTAPLHLVVPRPTTNKQHIKHLGGIEAVIAAMEGHLDDPRIQFAACYTLCNLASGGQEHAKAVITAGGLMSVTKAAQTHIEHKPVLRAAKDLQSILWNNIC